MRNMTSNQTDYDYTGVIEKLKYKKYDIEKGNTIDLKRY